MAFIGSLVAAQTAKAIGEYNAKVNRQQAAYWDKKAASQRAAYNQLDRPRLIKSQNRDYSNFFVNTLMTGAEFSGTNYAMALANKIEMGTDLVIADYNESTEFMETRNQSILFEQKAMTDIYKGRLGQVSEYAKAGGSLLSMANKNYGWIDV
jgi:hypothetical protein